MTDLETENSIGRTTNTPSDVKKDTTPKSENSYIIKRAFRPDMLAVYVAFIAVLLSQFPPLHTVLGKAKPTLSVDKFLIISHDLGRPNFHLPVTINNGGSRTANIKAISCEFKSVQGSFNRNVSVQAYYDSETLDGSRGLMNTAFGGLSIKPDEAWQNTISCFDPNDGEMTAVKMLLLEKSREFFRDYFAENPVTEQSAGLVSMPDHITDIARVKFDSEFWLVAGEYIFTLNATLDNGERVISAPVKVNISPLDYKILTNISEKYQYGFGISMPLQRPYTIQVIVGPTE